MASLMQSGQYSVDEISAVEIASRSPAQQQQMIYSDDRISQEMLAHKMRLQISSNSPSDCQKPNERFSGAKNAGDRQVLDANDHSTGGAELLHAGSAGSRWPRQETLALLKIRAEMDSEFKVATLKAPLWEDVSRRLAQLGYHRSAKKCKEKFENVHKYYKRTKEGRGRRQDGKTYRFFSQLEALYASSSNCTNNLKPLLLRDNAPPQQTIGNGTQLLLQKPPSMASFSSDDSDSTSPFSESESRLSEEEEAAAPRRKRKRWEASLMDFFGNLLKQVLEKQEAMQRKLLEEFEKREQDRMIREEAWKRQEMARLSRENELKSHERALAASRDTALINFLQKITGQRFQIPQLPTSNSQTLYLDHQKPLSDRHASSSDTDKMEPHSKRWPKPEVLSLIKLRTGMEERFHEPGPKAPLWQEISAEMGRLGYDRSAKRCKEKWENINKYFRKAKESNKKRPENSKTCPYFHHLDALYRSKVLGNSKMQPSLSIQQPREVSEEPRKTPDMEIQQRPRDNSSETNDADSQKAQQQKDETTVTVDHFLEMLPAHSESNKPSDSAAEADPSSPFMVMVHNRFREPSQADASSSHFNTSTSPATQ